VFTSPNHLGEITRLLCIIKLFSFIDFVEELTGIELYLTLTLKGLNDSNSEGGYMKIHADVNQYRKQILTVDWFFALSQKIGKRSRTSRALEYKHDLSAANTPYL